MLKSSYFDTEPDGKREEEENQSQDEDHQQPLKHSQVLALQTCRDPQLLVRRNPTKILRLNRIGSTKNPPTAHTMYHACLQASTHRPPAPLPPGAPGSLP